MVTFEPPEHPAAIPYATPAPRRRFGALVAAGLIVGSLLVTGLLLTWLARSYVVRVQPRAATAAAPAPAPAGKGGTPAWATPPPPAPLQPPPPPELDLSGGPVRMTITQRDAQAIPGSYGSLFVRIGDITARQVHLEVHAADGQSLVAKSVREGDALEFEVNGERFVVVASEFVNAVLHDDRGVFVVRRPTDPPDDAELIARLIDAAEKSGAVVIAPPGAAQRPEVFVGTTNDAGDPRPAGEYLRDVWWFSRKKTRTAADLARAAATHPAAADSGSNEPVQLKLRFPDGTEHPAGEWLVAEVSKLTIGPSGNAAGPAD